ncbi:MAG: ornithine cyclodeaminase family protein [Mycobacteriales bacterium]
MDLVRSLAAEMSAALRRGAVRRMTVPRREVVEDPTGRKYVSMPAVSPDYDLFINKTATIVPDSVGGRDTTVTSVVSVFAAGSGRVLRVMDGAVVTNLKCAAVTALVTDRCAAPAGGVLGIIGAGVQARLQYRAVSAVRDLEEVRIYSRTADRAAAFGRHVAQAAGDGTRVVVCGSAADASRGVDILATATTSAAPLPISPDLSDHVHVNCMGAHTVGSRELDADLLRSSVLIVEDRATAVAEAGDLHRTAIELDALESPAAAGLDRRRTVFSSTGCASLDLITCAHLGQVPAAAERELDVLTRRLDLDVPADLAGGVLHGYRALREMTTLLRQAGPSAGGAGGAGTEAPDA